MERGLSIHADWARELKAPRGQSHHLETCFPEFVSNAERSGVLGNTNDQGTDHVLSYLCHHFY